MTVLTRGGGGGGSPPGGRAGLTQTQALLLAFPTPRAESGYGTQNQGGEFGRRFPSGADGTWIELEAALTAGTYILLMNAAAATFAPIVTFSIDDGSGLVNIDDPPYNASSASVDQYNISDVDFFKYEVCDDLTIPTDGVYAVRVTTTGKNAASSGFFGNMSYLCLLRTGATLGPVA